MALSVVVILLKIKSENFSQKVWSIKLFWKLESRNWSGKKQLFLQIGGRGSKFMVFDVSCCKCVKGFDIIY